MLRPTKNDLGLKVAGMFQIPHECGKVYIGQIGRSTGARCREHMRHICLEQPEKSAVAEHSVNAGHCPRLQQYLCVAQGSRVCGLPCKEAIEIRLNTKYT
jgi:hypothetical protein